ncbi:MAG: sensor histidine kinase [Gammaproteobacteria bacterium]|nr:sensor histidine kinase [Gammaproteobacteria bacterium]
MNLQKQLLLRIIFIALFCLTASAFYVLYQTDKQAIYEANLTANTIEKQLRLQLLKMFSRYDFSSTFPNSDLWSDLNGVSGSCIQFISSTQSRQRRFCNTAEQTKQTWPAWFNSLYQHVFTPDYSARRNVAFNALDYGSIVVTLNTNLETARAWNNLQAIIGVLTISIFAVALLVFVTINRMLKPAHNIVSGLEKMRDGHLDIRLSDFDVTEWKRTAEAINQLAASQEQMMADNKRLALKLINVQEEEHRYIARELHDEFGQCLAGINAVVSCVHQTARTQCPEIVPEIKNISHITQHMMDLLRSMLIRLRPAEVDDFGLQSSLQKLISSWNNRAKNNTHYQLELIGDCEQLNEPLPVTIYRIVQECLTNIAKHANASQATIELTIIAHQQVILTISDDGVAGTESFDNVIGVGLLGIRERVAALGGSITITTRQPSGLTIAINLPLLSDK